MSEFVEEIVHESALIAVILRAEYRRDGIEFFTPNSFSQQLAYMNRPAGYKIAPHVHNEIRREVYYTQEALFVKKGRARVDFYDSSGKFLESRVLEKGDVILLASGGHGLEMLEDTELVEVKQGPYSGDQDKKHLPVDD